MYYRRVIHVILLCFGRTLVGSTKTFCQRQCAAFSATPVPSPIFTNSMTNQLWTRKTFKMWSQGKTLLKFEHSTATQILREIKFAKFHSLESPKLPKIDLLGKIEFCWKNDQIATKSSISQETLTWFDAKLLTICKVAAVLWFHGNFSIWEFLDLNNLMAFFSKLFGWSEVISPSVLTHQFPPCNLRQF